jgi:hypothetical protein
MHMPAAGSASRKGYAPTHQSVAAFIAHDARGTAGRGMSE